MSPPIRGLTVQDLLELQRAHDWVRKLYDLADDECVHCGHRRGHHVIDLEDEELQCRACHPSGWGPTCGREAFMFPKLQSSSFRHLRRVAYGLALKSFEK